MIHLEKGQKLFDTEGMVVYDQTGFYNDGDSIICAMAFAPEEPVCRYEAQYIAYGNMVYNISDPAQLLEEVKKLDPASLFGKNKEEIAVDKLINNIETSTSEDLTTADATTADTVTEGEVAGATTETTEETASTTPETETTPVVEETVPEVIIPTESTSTSTSSTTPETIIETITEPIATSTATSTPIVETVIEPTVEQVIPTIENVIEQLNTVSDIVENVASSTNTNITP